MNLIGIHCTVTFLVFSISMCPGSFTYKRMLQVREEVFKECQYAHFPDEVAIYVPH